MPSGADRLCSKARCPELVLEDDGEPRSDSVPFAGASLPLGKSNIDRQADQFGCCTVAWEVATRADGAPDFRVLGFSGDCSADLPASLKEVCCCLVSSFP